MFEFTIAYTHRSNDPYYYTNWEKGGRATILAKTKPQALENLWNMLGPAPQNRCWVGQVLAVKQVSVDKDGTLMVE